MRNQPLLIEVFILAIRPKTNSCVSGSLPVKKTGSVGRIYFFFANSTKQLFSLFSKKYKQCHQAVDSGDMYYGRSFINSGKSRGPRVLPKGTP